MLSLKKYLNPFFRYWEPYRIDLDIHNNRQRRETRVLQILEGIGFSWRVYFVAFLGFLASSWSLIAINITMPALFFVYETDLSTETDLVLDMVTLTGTVFSMVVFGHLADRIGRSALYGFELLIVLSAVGGAAFSSQGYGKSMDIYAALIWWRFTLGLGIGAEYPMSAVIAAEFASTAWRSTMLAAIFLAQPVGRLLAYGLSLGILYGFENATRQNIDIPLGAIESGQQSELAKETVDKVWRLVLGLAGVPAVFAVALRIFIPETPRFYSAIRRDLRRAYEAAVRIGSTSPHSQDTESVVSEDPDERGTHHRPNAPWATAAWSYFFGASQGWKRLLSITLQWLLLDVCFYGTGLDSPSTLAALWLDESPENPAHIWNEDPGKPNTGIYRVLVDNSYRTLLTTSIAALVGSILVIPSVGIFTRKSHYVVTSALLAVMFAATAISISKTYADPLTHNVSVVLYAITQFLFNVGPNTLTFIIAVETFPTEFRGTCYGIAAAGGKVGAIIIRPIVQSIKTKDEHSLPILLGIFAIIMALMAALAWFEPYGIGIPKVQGVNQEEKWSNRIYSLSLEEISPWPLVDDEKQQSSDQQHAEVLWNPKTKMRTVKQSRHVMDRLPKVRR